MQGTDIVYQIAFTLVANVAVSAAVGYGLDHWLHTGKLFLILSVVVSFFTGMYWCYGIIAGMDNPKK
jgi:F0F1-type ATP synthase assembly protein I